MTNWTRVLHALAPHGRADIVAMIADHADEVFPRFGITTIRRQACIIAHACVETDSFMTLEENLNYSAERLHAVWPKRFPSVESAAPFAHAPHALALNVYGDRLGNRRGTDDGWNFRGQGLWQSTGREKGEKLGKILGVAPETVAAWLVDPAHALECACALHKLLGVERYADAGDVRGQTKHINGGLNGLAERQAAFDKAVKLLTAEAHVARMASEAAPEAQEELPAKVLARDLRQAGSRTIAGTDRVKGGLSNLATGAATAGAAASQVSDVAGQASDAADSVTGAVHSSAAALTWVEGHWKVLAIVAGLILVATALWQIWRGAAQAEAARVDDANSGVNVSR